MERLSLESIHEILGSYVIPKDELLDNYLRPQFENFLERYPEYFMVENGMVCTNSQQLMRGREEAVTYYSDILSTYEEPCYYMNLRGHIGQADKDIIAFIETFYPQEDFMDFLLAHPDDFVVFDDNKVHNVEEMEYKSVEFFRDCLEKFGGGKYFTDFRGHYTHSKYVRQYIQEYYPGEDFWDFLNNNDYVFDFEDGYVYLR